MISDFVQDEDEERIVFDKMHRGRMYGEESRPNISRQGSCNHPAGSDRPPVVGSRRPCSVSGLDSSCAAALLTSASLPLRI